MAEASGKTLYAGTPSDGTGAGFLLSSLSSDPFTRTCFQIEEDVEDYYQQFMTYYQSQGIQPVQILYPPRFYAQQKS